MKCMNCGDCCRPCLQMTQEEIDTIKKYIEDNNIKEHIYEKDGKLEYVCPFRDRKNKQCTIYKVRPTVCRLFACWIEGYGLEGYVQMIIDTSVTTGCNAHEIFFNNTNFKKRYKNEQQ